MLVKSSSQDDFWSLFSIHIWDPFVGSGVHQIDGSAAGRLGGPVTVMTTMSPTSSCLILAATQHDGLLHLIDCRVGQVSLQPFAVKPECWFTWEGQLMIASGCLEKNRILTIPSKTKKYSFVLLCLVLISSPTSSWFGFLCLLIAYL